jgi:hypothetical protein
LAKRCEAKLKNKERSSPKHPLNMRMWHSIDEKIDDKNFMGVEIVLWG